MKKTISILACLCILLSAMGVLSVSAEEKNLAVNPGFEEELHLDEVESVFDPYLTWTPRDASWCKLQLTTEEKHSGNKSLKVTDRLYWWAAPYQIGYTFVKKEPITFSVWVKLEKGSGDRLMRFAIFDKNGNDLVAMMGAPAEITASDKEWREIKGTFTPAGNLKEAFIGIQYQPADSSDASQMNWSGAYYVDDVFISSASGSTTAGSTNKPIISAETTANKPDTDTDKTTAEQPDTDTDNTTLIDHTGSSTAISTQEDSKTTDSTLGSSEVNSHATTTVSGTSTTPADDGSMLWLWIVLGVIIVGGAGAAVYFLVIKKSRKDKSV